MPPGRPSLAHCHGLVERPGKVLDRVAEVRHLPVHNPVDRAILAEQEVPDAVVAVDYADALGGGGGFARSQRIAARITG